MDIRQITTEVQTGSYFDESWSIDRLIEHLNALKSMGATDVRFETEYESSSIEFAAYNIRDETPEEAAERTNAQNKANAEWEIEKLRRLEIEYQNLKSKLGH